MNIFIIANGEIEDYMWHKMFIKTEDKVICADGGANHAYEMGIIPNHIVGDLDSIKDNVLEFFVNNKVKVTRYPKEKDFTDTQLAIQLALSYRPSKIILMGTLGKRIDHTLANILQLTAFLDTNTTLKIINPYQEIWLIGPGKTFLDGNKGDIISLLPLTPVVTGITTEGLKYSLNNSTFEQTNPYGVSNVIIEDEASISQGMGIILVVRIIKED